MSVIVMGMEMPKNCAECEWGKYVGNERSMCLRVSMTDDAVMMAEHRADFCPLTEIPTPHGRLIDADKLANETFYGATSAPYITYRKFVNAPTVIEAEE